jgi:hypothetical protein
MKFKILFLLTCLLLLTNSCERDFTAILPPDGDAISYTAPIPFNTFFFRRGYFVDFESTELVILRSVEDQNNFLDTTNSVASIPIFNFYDDSMLVGIVYGEGASLSATFTIDSVILDSSLNEARVYSHLFNPVSQMFISLAPCHFVSLPKLDANFVMNAVRVINETITGEIIPFNTFLKGDHYFFSHSASPTLIVLKSEEEQTAFLDTTDLYIPFQFPFVNYSDSMLVGVIMNEIYVTTPFEIVSLIRNEQKIQVIARIFYGFPSLPDPGCPTHFVAIPKTDEEIELRDIEIIINGEL